MKNYSIGVLLLIFCGAAQAGNGFSFPDPTLPYHWIDPAIAEAAKASAEKSDAIKTGDVANDAAAVPSSVSKNGLTLSSIVYAPDRRFVLINGQMMREGDVVNNVKVIQITPQSVRVKQADKMMTLTLQNGSDNRSLKIIRR